jgi:hypothetical protein
MKFGCSQINGWDWRTSPYVKLVRFKKTKVACFLSYVKVVPIKIQTLPYILININRT